MGYLVKPGFPAFSRAVFSFWFNLPSASLPLPLVGPQPYPVPQLYGFNPLVTFGDPNILDMVGNPMEITNIGIYVGGGPPVYLHAMLQTNVTAANSGDSELDPGLFNIGGIDTTVITLDAWQHAAISFDLTGGCFGHWPEFPEGEGPTFESSDFFTWSLNDALMSEGSYIDCGDVIEGAPTKIVPVGVRGNIGSLGGNTSTFPATSIPAGPLAIPANIPDKVLPLRMAKFAMWTNEFLDFSNVGNRRLFIDGAGRPVPTSTATSALGKSPEIEFRTKDDWINGRNRGTAGNFTKVGTISPYSGTIGL